MRGMRVCSLRDWTRMDGHTVGWTDRRERSIHSTVPLLRADDPSPSLRGDAPQELASLPLPISEQPPAITFAESTSTRSRQRRHRRLQSIQMTADPGSLPMATPPARLQNTPRNTRQA
jgi:hypothetical protein